MVVMSMALAPLPGTNPGCYLLVMRPWASDSNSCPFISYSVVPLNDLTCLSTYGS